MEGGCGKHKQHVCKIGHIIATSNLLHASLLNDSAFLLGEYLSAVVTLLHKAAVQAALL